MLSPITLKHCACIASTVSIVWGCTAHRRAWCRVQCPSACDSQDDPVPTLALALSSPSIRSKGVAGAGPTGDGFGNVSDNVSDIEASSDDSRCVPRSPSSAKSPMSFEAVNNGPHDTSVPALAAPPVPTLLLALSTMGPIASAAPPSPLPFENVSEIEYSTDDEEYGVLGCSASV